MPIFQTTSPHLTTIENVRDVGNRQIIQDENNNANDLRVSKIQSPLKSLVGAKELDIPRLNTIDLKLNSIQERRPFIGTGESVMDITRSDDVRNKTLIKKQNQFNVNNIDMINESSMMKFNPVDLTS